MFQNAFASSHTTVSDIVNTLTTQVLNPLITLFFVLATVVFIWGVVQYVAGSGGDESKLKAGKRLMIWGIIGMFLMASAWGIVRLLCDFFGTCGDITFPTNS